MLSVKIKLILWKKQAIVQEVRSSNTLSPTEITEEISLY